MTKTKIWLSSPHMGGKEEFYVAKAFETNWIAPLGPNVLGFEKAIEHYIGNDINVAALSSGTAAIHLALKLLGVSAGDEVICQSFTFSASANPISYLGATPVFVDSERTTWNISPSLLEQAIQTRIKLGKKPKAIVAVHLYGMPYMVKEISDISIKYGIPIVEDSAEALGSKYMGLKCGQFGDIGIFSFNGNKIITTSGGGALTTRDESVKRRAVYLATQARDTAPHYQHSVIGHNYRMSNVLAGIGIGQMEVLAERVSSRRSNYEFYKSNLGSFTNIDFLEEPKDFYCNRWLTCILTDSLETREKIRIALQKEDIESRPLWKPMHLQPVFSDRPHFTDGTSEDLFNRGLCLPSGSNLTKDNLTMVVETIKEALSS